MQIRSTVVATYETVVTHIFEANRLGNVNGLGMAKTAMLWGYYKPHYREITNWLWCKLLYYFTWFYRKKIIERGETKRVQKPMTGGQMEHTTKG